jgi:broad specificity phosphatase PhoE
MTNLSKKIRTKIINNITRQLIKKKQIISLTFVGSFVDKNNFKKINDIDLIVVVKKLNKNIFNECLNEVYKVDPRKFNIDKEKLKINSSFGPLKFNFSDNEIVIHLMIYDIDGHINHVNSSPFTVYDWERSNYLIKKRLKDIYPTGTLQLRDFVESRRGIQNYLRDLSNEKISYREYRFYKNKYFIKILNQKLINRDKFEYIYHIVKNLILNYIKFYKQNNKLIKFHKNNKKIKKYLGHVFFNRHIKKINTLIEYKNRKKIKLNIHFDKWILLFVKDFQKIIDLKLKNSKKITFIRHAKTKLNNGTFLGQSLNPSISNTVNIKKNNTYDTIFSSPLDRCIESIRLITKNKKHFLENNLLEIDYGKAEGLDINQFSKKFPKIIQKWKEGKDSSFPEGESYAHLINRQELFIKKLKRSNFKNCCVVTHNVFIRVLIGKSFNIDKKDWFKIDIPHLLELDFLLIDGKLFPNISRSVLKVLFSNLTQ